MDAALSALPIVVLNYLMTKRSGLPPHVALPLVAVCSILGIANREGYIFLRTLGPMLLNGAIAGVVGSFT